MGAAVSVSLTPSQIASNSAFTLTLAPSCILSTNENGRDGNPVAAVVLNTKANSPEPRPRRTQKPCRKLLTPLLNTAPNALAVASSETTWLYSVMPA